MHFSNTPSNIVHIVCGSLRSLFLDSEGKLWSYGSNYCGQLGIVGSRTDVTLEPEAIVNIPPMIDIYCGTSHTPSNIVHIVCGSLRSLFLDSEGNLFSVKHNTPEKTIHLLKEYEIPIEDDVILKNNYCSSIF